MGSSPIRKVCIIKIKKKLNSFHIYNDNLNNTIQENLNIWVSFRLSQKTHSNLDYMDVHACTHFQEY